MENLNLSLNELKVISRAIHRLRGSSSTGIETAIKTIDAAIEACEAKAKADNDYAKKFYEGKDGDGAKVHYSCSVNLRLWSRCLQPFSQNDCRG